MNTRRCDLGIAKAGRGSAIGGKANRAQPQPRKGSEPHAIANGRV